jgi:Na+/H+ antiporter NhaD/arsenite permease-like protein
MIGIAQDSGWQLQWYHWLAMGISVIVLAIATRVLIHHCKRPRHTPERLLG